jgi:integrase
VATRRPKLGSIYQRGKIWWLKYYKNGRPHRESSESESYADAERLLKRRVGEIVTGKFAGLGPERIRFRDLAKEVLADYSDNHRSTCADVAQRLRLHLLPALGSIRAVELGTAHLKRYIAARRNDKAANATINRELAIVKRAFRIGAQSDPPSVMRIPHIPMLEENNVRKGFLEHKVYPVLRDLLPEEIRPLFVVGYYTGARIGELRPLQWYQVDLDGNRIILAPGTTKNKEGRTLPIYGEMKQWLAIEKEIRDTKWPDCPYVFHRAEMPVKDFRASWTAACKLAGVPGLLFHDLRRTAVRNMVRAGIPERVAMQISGHKTRSVFDRYNIVSDRDLLEAAVKMQLHLEAVGTITGTISNSTRAKRN